ncbi:hypothetical protein J2T12_000013 [Paenibacillus anaericanus]|uniref:Aspartyl-phosphate phosphatase Spo0E family protein n=1 Tax=Paenibacillus anaericanus TaxID=170367 RepID=A0A433YAR7_9BACL|nr:aspartyl-phosphate phosphatase Spo0E family protein [Paenibacillus anaericanus]MDQ0086619.1 hypothetical protein [Paenibacillus anaericanus]RUT46960.1 aspartyl-phosphate phosphatase Spo0E family protein [Paenibacillus anaericanus]
MEDLKQLLLQIEQLRQQLNNLNTNNNLTDPEIVVASQMLDAVLNEYYGLMKKKSKDKSN